MRPYIGIGLFCLLFSQSLSYAQPMASPSPSLSTSVSTGSSGGVEDQLKSAIFDHQAKLGNLEPWQKDLYLEEVIPQFQRFLRGYQAAPQGGMLVDIDDESLKRYLLFYGPRTIKKSDAVKDIRVLVLLKSDNTCQKCVDSLSSLQQLVKPRLERRGLIPVFIHQEELPAQANSHLFFDQLLSKSKIKGASGALLVNWELKPIDASDTAHADEKHYLIESYFQVGEFPVQSRQKEILENDSFENAEARILTEIFTDLGTKIELEQVGVAELGKEEMLVEITGIKDFNQFNRVKAALQGGLKDVASLEERIFSKNQVVFALYSKKNINELRKQIGQISLDPGGDQLLTVVVR